MKFLINKNNSVPLYYQIREQLRTMITDGSWSFNDQLPSERQLSEELDVSRVTIRKAVRELIAEGYCVKRSGEGIFIASPKYRINIHGFVGYSDFARKNGCEPRTIVLEQRVEACSKEVGRDLGIAPGAPVLYLKRVRCMGEMPALIEAAQLPLERYPGLERHDFTASLYEILRDEYGVTGSWGRGTLNIRFATAETSTHLGVPLSSLLMFKDVTVFTATDTAVEHLTSFYRTDIFEFAFESRISA